MNKLNLTLRQRKLLHMMQEQTGCITGNELAKQLNVSPRTIRSDIVEINQNIKPYEAQIISERSKGYRYEARNPEIIQQLNQIDTAFFTKEDRVRYLAFRLCLADEPLNLYDLEDEMFVSHTTLSHDLHLLRMKYVLAEPQIKLEQKRNNITFENNEVKRRSVLNRLFHEDWNYNKNWNTYYGYSFLDKDILDFMMAESPVYLDKYGISMEDPSLVSLNLALTIMYQRIVSGHTLPLTDPVPRTDLAASRAAEALAGVMESQLQCQLSPAERDDIYRRITSAHLPDLSNMELTELSKQFDPLTIKLTDLYIQRIQDVFDLDFSPDEDFRVTLLSYIQFLQSPTPIFFMQGNNDLTKRTLFVEFEIAYLFQDIAHDHLGYYLTQRELLYLAHCISGALEFLYSIHPETKLQVAICCHMNLPVAWALKRKVLGAFDHYMDVKALLPINIKNSYDFSNFDLILSTVQKTITQDPNTDTMVISPLLAPKDYMAISAYIQNKRADHICSSSKLCFNTLLEQAFWHEKETWADRFTIIQQMASDFLNEGLVEMPYMYDILQRESISTNAIGPGILFLHSLVPAKETRLSITTLDHRIMWNSYKIRIIILAAFKPEDVSFVFHLQRVFFDDNLDIHTLRMLKTKEEVIRFFS